MPKFYVQNLSDKAIKLTIEPWADLELLAPQATATFEYVEPAEIGFAMLPDDKVGVRRVCVDIVSDHIKVLANDHEKTFGAAPGD